MNIDSLRAQRDELDKEIRSLKDRRERIAADIKYFRKQDNDPGSTAVGGSERWAVSTAILAPVLVTSLHLNQMTQATLARRANVAAKTVRAVLHQKRKFCTWRTADALLTAIDQSHRLGHDIPIAPSPWLTRLEGCEDNSLDFSDDIC